MSDSREQMIAALRQSFIPALREAGFRGSFPHFRRIRSQQIDLLTIQFNRHGGSFVAEVSYCEPTGFTTHWGKPIPPNKVSAHDLHPDQRPRLGSAHEDRWFHYDPAQPSSYPEAAAELLSLLPTAEEFFRTHQLPPSAPPNNALQRTAGERLPFLSRLFSRRR